jgi:DNA-binding response OmpR family regulator
MLIDVDMPKMDGFELVREMKNIKTTDLTPIIYITGYDKNSKRATVGYDLGAVDYILKPFDMEFLLTKVRVFLKLYHQRKLLESEIASKSASQNVLIESNSMVNNLISESYSFVCSFDIKGKIESINLPSIDLLKAEKLGNILGMQFSKWVFNKDTPIFLEGLGKAAKGIQTEIKIRMQSTENDIIWLQLKILPKIKNEIIETIYCLGNDVSRSVFDETESENSK